MANNHGRQNIHPRGWLDTRERVQEGLAADPYISQLFTRNADLGDLRAQSTDIISAATTICCGIRYLADTRPVPQSSYLISLTIGELMSPVLPTDMCLTAVAANEVLMKILNTLITVPNIYTRRNTIEDWLAQMAAAEEQDDEDAEVGDDDRHAGNDVAAIRALIDGDQVENLQREHKIDFLIWLAAHMQSSQYLKTVALIVTSYVGVAKRGTISERFVEKVQTGMEAEIGVEVVLSTDIIRQAYTMFGRYVNSTNAAQVFDRWLTDVPEHALRLRLSLTQVTGSGLTAFVIIGRSMMKYATFNWAKLNVLTGGELACYNAALTTVAGNAYFGFNRDLGAARSTLYSSIAYVAKELLLRLNGETSLKGYRGWIKKPKSATVIEEMITRYVEQRTAELQNDEAGEEDVALYNAVAANVNGEGNVNLFA